MKRSIAVTVALVLVAGWAWAADSAYDGKTIDITKWTCKALMSGDDSDREVGIAFFHGFFAGKNGRQVVDVKSTSALSDKVRDYCLSNPTGTVMDAFTKLAK